MKSDWKTVSLFAGILLLLTSCTVSMSPLPDVSSPGSPLPLSTVEATHPHLETDQEYILKNDSLEVRIQKPGVLYRKSRFEWSGIINQVILDQRHTFYAMLPLEPGQGTAYGMMNAFEEANINPDLEFDAPGFDCTPYLPEVFRETASITFLKIFREGQQGVNHSFRLEKKISLDGDTVTVEQVLTNLGSKKLRTKEYGHNFMLLNGNPIGPDYTLELSFLPQLQQKPKVKGREIFSIQQQRLYITTEEIGNSFSNSFLTQIKGYDANAKETFWILKDRKSGISVMETVDFPIAKFQLWGKADTICPEVFVQIILDPGESFAWKRMYTYRR